MVLSVIPASAQTERSADADFFGEAAARRAVEHYLSERRIAFELRPLLAERGGFGVSLHATLHSSTGSDEIGTLVIAAPLSSGPGGSGTEPDFAVRAALAFADRVAVEGLPLDVRIAFLADERSQLPEDMRAETLLGLRDLVDLYEENERTAVIYLDVRGSPDHLRIVHGSAGTIAPLGILEPLLSAFDKLGSPLDLAVPFNELYRLGLVRGPEALSFLHERGFPALLVESNPLSRRGDVSGPVTAERFADGLFDYAVSLKGIPEAADRRYFLFSVGRRVFPLSEGLSVALFALTAALGLAAVLSYSLTHRHLLIARGKVFLIRSWVFPLFLAALFLCILSAGVVISFFLSIAGADSEKARYGAAALKFALAMVMYSVVAPLFSRRPFPLRAHFYGTAACLMFSAGSFLAAILDFTFVPIFIWAFICALASSLVRSSAAAFTLASLAPFQILVAAAAAVGSGENGPARILLSGGIWIDLFLAFIILPFLLLFRRAAALSRSKGGASQLRRAWYTRLLFFVGTLLTILSYSRDVARAERMRAKPVRERIVSADSKLPPLSIEVKSRTFLDRRTILVTLRPESNPVRLDLSFESDSDISIYDAPVPWVLSESDKSVDLILGERPRVPLELELTLPRSAKGTLSASALYLRPPDESVREVPADYALTVAASIGIGGEN